MGTTTFRPPYVPVASDSSPPATAATLYDPIRATALHAWHVAHGAVFEDVGQWMRPWYFPHAGEDMHAAVRARVPRRAEGVAVMDASTLGKIDVQGPDAARVPEPPVHQLVRPAGRRARFATGSCAARMGWSSTTAW